MVDNKIYRNTDRLDPSKAELVKFKFKPGKEQILSNATKKPTKLLQVLDYNKKYLYFVKIPDAFLVLSEHYDSIDIEYLKNKITRTY